MNKTLLFLMLVVACGKSYSSEISRSANQSSHTTYSHSNNDVIQYLEAMAEDISRQAIPLTSKNSTSDTVYSFCTWSINICAFKKQKL